MMRESSAENKVNLEDIQEVLEIIGKLNEKEKELVLAALRGAVLIADARKK